MLPGEKLRIEVLRERYDVGALRSEKRSIDYRLRTRQSARSEGFASKPVSSTELLELTRTRCWINEVALRESIAHGEQAWEEGILLASTGSRAFLRALKGIQRLTRQWSELHRTFQRVAVSGV